MLWLLIGESGSGKSSLEKSLVDSGIAKRIISYTTRSPRQNEVNGIDYYFISEKEFLYLSINGKLLESTEYNGNFYGASIDVDYINNDYVIVVEPNGAREIKEKLGYNCKSIYIFTTETTRKIRMKERGDLLNNIINRIVNDRETFNGIEKEVDYILFNDNRTIEQSILALSFFIKG